ncbi:class I SAM-dependent methyltransferase [Luminiphilus sp.]|nr:class I SAM-dependent methyltransferase [Luminiphilus sp.]
MNQSNKNWGSAVHKTNRFYQLQGGFSYSDEQVNRWLTKWFHPFVELKGTERILDLCCGDGVWSFGLLRRYPSILVSGVDVSDQAVENANKRATMLGLSDRATFIAYDCETWLPFPEEAFDLIFARGVFVFNQHNMMRPGCLRLLEHWQEKLANGGRFVAMYGSKPDRFGKYTPPEETKGLPTNLERRETPAVDFRGGKFNHNPVTFLQPFMALHNAQIEFYQFSAGRHTLICRPKQDVTVSGA